MEVYTKGEPLTFAGRTLSIAAWASEIGLTESALRWRLARWSPERALRSPTRSGGRAIRRTLEDRFTQFVERRGGCLEWTGQLTPDGYGTLYVPPKDRARVGGRIHVGAHRLALILAGCDPGIAMVLHSCDNRACVDVAHLRTGTHLDNMRDMRERARSAVGERQHLAKLSASDVVEMRRLFTEGWSTVALGRRFNVAQQTAWSVVTRRTWRHVA